METNIVTYKTEDYSIFKNIVGNRHLSENNIRGIIRNVRERGLKPTIVICNEKLEVIDGQHRIEAFKRLGLPIYYQIHRGLTLDDCITMNISGTIWKTDDYVNSYAETGDEMYVELKRLSSLYPMFTYSNIASIVNADSTSTVGHNIKYKTLHLDLTGKDAERKLDFVSDIYLKLKDNLTGRKECFFTVLSRLMDLSLIDVKRLKEQLYKYGNTLIHDIVDIQGTLIKLEEVYNYRKGSRVRFISAYYSKYEDIFKKNKNKEK